MLLSPAKRSCAKGEDWLLVNSGRWCVSAMELLWRLLSAKAQIDWAARSATGPAVTWRLLHIVHWQLRGGFDQGERLAVFHGLFGIHQKPF